MQEAGQEAGQQEMAGGGQAATTLQSTGGQQDNTGATTVMASDTEVANGFVKNGTSLPYVIETSKSGNRKRSSKILPVCGLCGKKFVCVTTMKRHLVTHTGEKPFNCKVCGKKYTQKGNLRVHERTHRNDRPFKCNICQQKFYRKEPMQKHQWRQHGIGHYKSRPNEGGAAIGIIGAESVLYNSLIERIKTGGGAGGLAEPGGLEAAVEVPEPASHAEIRETEHEEPEEEEVEENPVVVDTTPALPSPPEPGETDIARPMKLKVKLAQAYLREVEQHREREERDSKEREGRDSQTARQPDSRTSRDTHYTRQYQTLPDSRPQYQTLQDQTVTQYQTLPDQPVTQYQTLPDKLVTQYQTLPDQTVTQYQTLPDQTVAQYQTLPDQSSINNIEENLCEIQLSSTESGGAAECGKETVVECTCKACGSRCLVSDPYNFSCQHCNVKYTSLPTHLIADPLQCIGCLQTFAHKPAMKEHQSSADKERPFVCCKCGYEFKQKAHLQKHQWRIHRRKLEPDPNVKEAEAILQAVNEMVAVSEPAVQQETQLTIQQIIDRGVEREISRENAAVGPAKPLDLSPCKMYGSANSITAWVQQVETARTPIVPDISIHRTGPGGGAEGGAGGGAGLQDQTAPRLSALTIQLLEPQPASKPFAVKSVPGSSVGAGWRSALRDDNPLLNTVAAAAPVPVPLPGLDRASKRARTVGRGPEQSCAQDLSNPAPAPPSPPLNLSAKRIDPSDLPFDYRIGRSELISGQLKRLKNQDERSGI